MSAPTASLPVKVLLTVTYIVMIAVNALANIIPINGRNTGEVSDAYGNLFAPAALTFAIWGVIYLMLGLHVLYQWGLFRRAGDVSVDVLTRIARLFSASSVANAGWILAWHYDFIALSTILMLVILALLGLIVVTLLGATPSLREQLLVRVPFSIYFGWITVATVANITVLLVSFDWGGFGLSEQVWAVVIIAVAAIIGTITVLRNRDVAYGLVLLWAFSGILLKHTSTSGFDGQYPAVIVTVIACLVIFVLAEGTVVARIRRRSKGLTSGRRQGA